MKRSLTIILFMLLSLYVFTATLTAAGKDTVVISGYSPDRVLSEDSSLDEGKNGLDNYCSVLKGGTGSASKEPLKTDSDGSAPVRSNNAVLTDISIEFGEMYVFLFIDAALALLCLILYKIRNNMLRRRWDNDKTER